MDYDYGAKWRPASNASQDGFMYDNCLVSNREGLGTSLWIMGLATIDPHSQEEHTEIHKIPKFGVNQASFDYTAI